MAHEPTNHTITATARNLRNYSDFAKNYIMDRPIVKLFDFSNFQDGTPANMVSMGGGAPILTEINASEIAGLYMDTNLDSYGFQVVLPYDMDVNEDADFRFLWSNSEAAATGAGLWVMFYNAVHVGVNTAIAVAATQIDVPIQNQVDLAIDVQQWTSWGSISAGALANLTPGDDVLHCCINMTTLDTIADATLYCGQMRYYRRYI
jgi:hypothetical protein